MKAITLTQPWATLIAIGEKRIETRSWPTHYRGPLAIHAAKGTGPIGGDLGLVLLIEREPFASVLRPHLHGYTAEERAADLPRGEIVAVCNLHDCVPTDGGAAVAAYYAHYPIKPSKAEEHELAFGDHTAGRWAWTLHRITGLAAPIECRGMQGLWDVPEEIRRELAEVSDVARTEAERAAIDREYESERRG